MFPVIKRRSMVTIIQESVDLISEAAVAMKFICGEQIFVYWTYSRSRVFTLTPQQKIFPQMNESRLLVRYCPRVNNNHSDESRCKDSQNWKTKQNTTLIKLKKTKPIRLLVRCMSSDEPHRHKSLSIAQSLSGKTPGSIFHWTSRLHILNKLIK